MFFSAEIISIETHAQIRIDEEADFVGQPIFEVTLPEIEFWVEPEQIARGEPVVLRWNSIEAEEAFFWKTTVMPTAPEPLDWWRISDLAEKVRLTDEVTLTPEETTAYFLIANNCKGICGKRIVVEVIEEQQLPEETFICNPSKAVLKKMEIIPQVGWIGQSNRPELLNEIIVSQIKLLGKEWSAPTDPPIIKISANPEVIFEDESTTLSWNIANANYAEHSMITRGSYLLVDLFKPSGTKQDGGKWGSGGSPPCKNAKCMNGSWSIVGKAHKQQHIIVSIKASNILGKTKAASQWVDVLSIPKFKGTYTKSYSGYKSREAWIRNTLKYIDKKLREGYILNNSGLDKKVLAFKDGHLSRQQIWANLLRLLQNIKLVTFICEETTNKNAASASFKSYSNDFYFRWKPSYNLGPSEYAVLHEMVHKVGFHDSLLKYYSVSSIENQTDLVASIIFP